jgi:hypothetical protein
MFWMFQPLGNPGIMMIPHDEHVVQMEVSVLSWGYPISSIFPWDFPMETIQRAWGDPPELKPNGLKW